MTHNFFAAISRMKYIERWALMRSSRAENLSEHAMEVAMIAHALCTIGNIRFGRHLDADRAAVIGLFHDASEIITGDMPTPVKYYNEDIRKAYKDVEAIAEQRLLTRLPDDMKPVYEDIFGLSGLHFHASGDISDEELRAAEENERLLRRFVKAADKLSALIKCIEEVNVGNNEFKTARITLRDAVNRLADELPEVKVFRDEFLPPYGHTLDELS